MNEILPLLRKAERSFVEAAGTLERGNPDFAASRAYYGCFYIAQALLLSEGLEFASHGQVAQFGRHFAKTKKLDPVFHQLLTRAFQLRQNADYDSSATNQYGVGPGDSRRRPPISGRSRCLPDS